MDQCDSKEILSKYAYIYDEKQPKKPLKTKVRVKDLLQNCTFPKLCELYLYTHQLEAFKLLSDGKNLIIAASTGSGKTESWFIYALKKMMEENFRVLVFYPTKALSNNQTERFYNYMLNLGFDVNKKEKSIYYGDLVRIDGDTSKDQDVINSLPNAKVIVTNPEMFLKHVNNFHSPDLIVIDELDYYDSGRATTLIEALKYAFPSAQLVVMSGSLLNPKDIASYIDAEVVFGEAFTPQQRNFIIIGKEDKVKAVYERNSKKLSTFYGISSYQDFKNRIFEVYYESFIKKDTSLSRDIGSVFLKSRAELEEFLKLYKECKGGATIAFFKTITDCEIYGRSLSVNFHHSKVGRDLRVEIEEKLREGKINYVFSVKTLLQGIDIGTISRVIHVGLPDLVRDFKQREGRKGRREDIPFTESIILPLGFDSRLIKGFESLNSWLSTGSEAVIYNKDNELVKLYLSYIKAKIFGLSELSPDEKRILEAFDIVRDNMLKEYNIGFYSLYNRTYPLTVKVGDSVKEKEIISKKDIVEFYQIGYIDLYNKAIVDEINEINEKERTTYEVIEKQPEEVQRQCIKDAISEYQKIVTDWGNRYGKGLRPNITMDMELGKIVSKVLVDINFEREGFTKVTEFPRGVRWYVESRTTLPIRRNGELTYDYLNEKINLNCVSYATYDDVTYAYAYEVKDINVEEAMAFFITILRLKYNVSTDLLNYSYFNNILKVWENRAVGLLEKMRGDGLEFNSKELNYENFIQDIETIDVKDQTFLLIFYKVYPVKGVNLEKAREGAKVLAMKLFNRAKIYNIDVNTNIKKDIIIYDRIEVNDNGVNKTYHALVYYDMGAEKAEIFNDTKNLKNRLLQIITERNISEVLHIVDPKDVFTGLAVKNRNLKVEFNTKKGIEVDPADFSEKVKMMMMKSKVDENLFIARAKVIQGIANYLEEAQAVKSTYA